MSALSNKELVAMLKSLEEQGARLSKTKKGTRIMFPDGTSMGIHWTQSDSRSTMNMRSRVRRAGLVWPFDDNSGEGKTKVGLRLSKDSIDKLEDVIVGLGAGPTTVTEAARLGGVSEPTARKYMIQRGFVQEKRGVWTHHTTLEETTEYPEITQARQLPKPAAPVAAPVAPQPPKVGDREFVDDVDSWTVPVPADLQAMADQMGLQIEVRVWRK